MRPTRRDFLASCGTAAAVPMLGGTAWPRTQDEAKPAVFAPEIGVCRGPDDDESARRGGAQYLEIRCTGDLRPLGSDNDQKQAQAILGTSALPPRAANNFLPGDFRCVGKAAGHGPILRYVEQAFFLAARAGIEVLTFGSARARKLPDGYARADAELQFVSLLARMADIARGHGIFVGIEPLQESESNFINTLAEADRLAKAVAHPNIGVTADLFHMLRAGEKHDAIWLAGSRVRHVHIAENEGRDAPGTHGEDFTPYLQALKDIGYKGRISIECRWQDFDVQLPKAVATLRDQLAALD